MKVLCKKSIKDFKKGQWYDAINQDIPFHSGIRAEYREFRNCYLVLVPKSSGCLLFYTEKSKFSNIGENIFSKYFYTKQEARKEKLTQLKNK